MKKTFNSRRYGADSIGEVADTPRKVYNEKGEFVNDPEGAQQNKITGYMPNYIDFTDAYAGQGKIIAFTHVPSQKQVFFKAFITAYNETFNSSWKEEAVYGRNDPIFAFQNTVRKITLAFKVPAGTKSEAFENLGRVSKLAQFLYPYYDNVDNASTIAQSPLIRIKMMNMIGSQAKYSKGFNEAATHALGSDASQYGVRFGDLGGGSRVEALQMNTVADQSSEALLGVVSNLSFAHNLDSDVGVIEYPGGVLPKLIEVNLDFSVIHESPLGWEKTANGVQFASRAFPYGVDLGDEDSLSDSAGPADIISQNAQRFNKLTEEQEAEDRGDAINQQAQDNAAARYLNAKGEMGLLGRVQLASDKRTLRRANKAGRESQRLGTIGSAVAIQAGLTVSEEVAGEHYGGDDYWDFIE